MSRKLFITTCFSLVAIVSVAQNLSQQVVATGGDYHSNGTGSISYTVGEPITETVYSRDARLTQGFQQGFIYFVGIEPTPEPAYAWQVFPNPTISTATIIIEGIDNFDVLIYDTQGKLVQTYSLQSPGTMDLATISAGSYHLQIVDVQGQLLGTSQLIKLN